MEHRRAAEHEEKRQYWEAVFKDWRASGLSQAQYCREKHLQVHRFWYWRKRIHPEQPSAVLVELPVRTALARPAAPITVVVEGGWRIELQEGFDPAVLEQVLRVVGRL